MPSGSLQIARPGDLIWPGSRISPIKWHVGGQPWYPAECGVPEASQLRCEVCGERLKHILHVSAASFAEFLIFFLNKNFYRLSPVFAGRLASRKRH
jgi:hypothetical protein